MIHMKYFREALGTVDNIIEPSTDIYNEIIEFLSKKGSFLNRAISKQKFYKNRPLYIGNMNINIGNLQINTIHLNIKGIIDKTISKEITPLLYELNIRTPHSDSTDTHYIYDENDIREVYLTLLYKINGKNIYQEALDDMIENKHLYIRYISHELKHVFDYYKMKKSSFNKAATYDVIMNTYYNVDAIDNFLFNLYYTNEAENLVRNTEISTEIKLKGITKSQFKSFLNELDIYKKLKSIRTFKFDDIKSKLIITEIPKIKKYLKKSNTKYDKSLTDEELVDFFLNLVISNLSISHKNIMNLLASKTPIHFPTKDFYQKKINEMNIIADKVMKKIHKLYAMCKDD